VSADPAQIREMFDRISPAYDVMNRVMSLGLDGRWRRFAAGTAGLRPGDAALDVCCGTGDLAAELRRRVGPSGRVVGVDFAGEMLARALHRHEGVEWVQGDALALPFGDGEFDAAAVAFGVRNLADHRRGFAEMARVVRPGGRVVCLELTRPPAALAPFARLWTDRLVPLVGRLADRGGAYTYLPASVRRFPPPEELAGTMRAAGLQRVQHVRLAPGVVAVHAGTVPA
jgi:demethylmenaquinone methyltransferase/2-methoxy-6-polyprenyl-1,4-benzoquinol methylase